LHAQPRLSARIFLPGRPTEPRRAVHRRNIAEGNGRFTKANRRNFFGIARGSVQERVPLLELASRQRLLQPERHQHLKVDLEEIARTLSGLINSLEKRGSPAAIEQATSRSVE